VKHFKYFQEYAGKGQAIQVKYRKRIKRTISQLTKKKELEKKLLLGNKTGKETTE